jgi:hypothetical protein
VTSGGCTNRQAGELLLTVSYANICIDSFMACPTGDESDDIVVFVFFHDASRARTTHTGVFIGDGCQTIVFEYDEIDENSLRSAGVASGWLTPNIDSPNF